MGLVNWLTVTFTNSCTYGLTMSLFFFLLVNVISLDGKTVNYTLRSTKCYGTGMRHDYCPHVIPSEYVLEQSTCKANPESGKPCLYCVGTNRFVAGSFFTCYLKNTLDSGGYSFEWHLNGVKISGSSSLGEQFQVNRGLLGGKWWSSLKSRYPTTGGNFTFSAFQRKYDADYSRYVETLGSVSFTSEIAEFKKSKEPCTGTVYAWYGKDAFVKCPVSGNPQPVAYNLRSGSRKIFATTEGIHIKNVTTLAGYRVVLMSPLINASGTADYEDEDRGIYYLHTANYHLDAAMQYLDITIRLYCPVVVTGFKESYVAEEGEALDVHCRASGYDPLVHIFPIKDKDIGRNYDLSLKPASSYYNSKNFKDTEHGDFKHAARWPIRADARYENLICLAASEQYPDFDPKRLGKTHNYQIAVFKVKPHWLGQNNQTLNKAEGESANITCSFLGHPVPNITILKNGEMIYPSNSILEEGISFVSTEGPKEKSRHVTLKFDALTADDMGVYTCIGDNGLLEDKRININLNVTYETQFKGASEVWLWPGSSVNVTCIFDGNPAPGDVTIRNADSDQPLQNIVRYKKDRISAAYIEFADLTNDQIKDLMQSVSTYTCEVGDLSHSIAVKVAGTPGQPLVELSRSGPTTLDLDISLPNYRGPPLMHYIASYGQPPKTITKEVDTNLLAISGLKPHTQYTFSVLAVNQLGEGLPTVVSFTTEMPGPPGMPTLHRPDTGKKFVSLSWDAEDNGAPVTGILIRYRKVDEDDKPESEWTEYNTFSLDNGAQKFRLSGLEPITMYEVGLKLVNAHGESSEGTMIFTTAADTVESSPSSAVTLLLSMQLLFIAYLI